MSCERAKVVAAATRGEISRTVLRQEVEHTYTQQKLVMNVVLRLPMTARFGPFCRMVYIVIILVGRQLARLRVLNHIPAPHRRSTRR
jgi:hypothetical protein